MFILLEDSIKRSTNFDEIVDKDLKDLLPQKCPCSGPYFPAFVLNTERYGVFPYSIWMWGNGDQDKSEKVQMVTLFTQWLLLNNCGEYDDVEEILIEVKNFQIKKSTTKTKRVTQETIAFSIDVWWIFQVAISELAHLLPMIFMQTMHWLTITKANLHTFSPGQKSYGYVHGFSIKKLERIKISFRA